jgi:hypothetical protein
MIASQLTGKHVLKPESLLNQGAVLINPHGMMLFGTASGQRVFS